MPVNSPFSEQVHDDVMGQHQAYTDPRHGPLIIMRDTLRAAIEGKTGGRLTVLYDSAGNPNVMHVLPRFRYEDLGYSTELGTGTCTAFDVGSGSMRSEIFIGAYQARSVGGLACSLPHQNPWASINYDNAKAACDNKGAGWHLMTVHEWAAVALWCLAKGFQPRGNTNHGRAHDAPHEVGTRQDGNTYAPGEAVGVGNTLTGSGPAGWYHDGTYAGIADLVGNVWEWNWGAKLVDGNLFAAPDNNYSLAEASWPDTTVNITASRTWASGATDTGTQLTDRLMYTYKGINAQGYLYVNAAGERLPLRGGARNDGSNAGLAALSLSYARSIAGSSFGFRPCYVV
ncbi:MAG: SUMF1/EgtB/PvdO family nonheme iron enzyme [Wenzhouxiangella sp.]|jgi:hypothetical protein|nr:SUMF1/EgtB/PvdO family nonheme iron enzyme [Wenzhouxiangella sp.]